jgi:gliding motility-associated lipoprotein GldH
MGSKKILFFFATVCLLLSACNSGVVYSKYNTFEKNEWFSKDKANFEVEITDIENLYDVNLMVRHAEAYPYSNLFLFLTTTYPDGKSTVDTLECRLSNSKGEWLGNGAGDIFDLTVGLSKSLKFPQAGKYIFSFEQAMRTDPLPLIMDFGMEIKKAKGVK